MNYFRWVLRSKLYWLIVIAYFIFKLWRGDVKMIEYLGVLLNSMFLVGLAFWIIWLFVRKRFKKNGP